MFGAPAASNAPASFSFGSASTAPKPSLFGAPASSNSPSTSLFGQPAASSGQQQPTTSLFGQPAQQQQPSTSLFGSTNQSQGSSLFGAPKPASPAPGSLFGSTAPQQQQGSSLFGSTSNPPAAQQSTSLFGQPQQNSTSLFGQPQQQQQQQQQGQQQQQQQQQGGLGQSQAGGQGEISKTTKLSELPAEAQRLVEGIDSFINQQIALSHSLSQHPLSATSTSYSPSTPTIPQTSNLLKRLITETTSLTHNLNNSSRQLQELQKRVTLDGEDAVRGARIMDASKTPQGRQSLRGQAKFPHEYFTRLTEDMAVRVTTYQNAMNQLSQTLSSLLPSSSSSSSAYNHPLSTSSHHPPTPTQISQTLQNHQLLLQRLAAQIAFLNEEVSALKDEFRVLWRERGGGGGSVRDVFDREREGRREEELRVEELGRSMRL